MLDELVRRISEKTGLPEDQARSAAEAAIGFVKEKLPAPIAGQVDSYLGTTGGGGNSSAGAGGNEEGGGDLLGQAQNALGNLGGLFGGGKKE